MMELDWRAEVKEELDCLLRCHGSFNLKGVQKEVEIYEVSPCSLTMVPRTHQLDTTVSCRRNKAAMKRPGGRGCIYWSIGCASRPG